MRLSSRTAAAVILLMLLSGHLSAAPHTSEHVQSVSALRTEFRPTMPEVALGAPILVHFHLENAGKQPLAVDLGPFREASFHIHATTPTGLLEQGSWHIHSGAGLPGKIYLEPGATYEQDLILGRWLTIRQAGSYQISSGLHAAVYQGGQYRKPFYMGGERMGTLRAEQHFALRVKDDPELAAEVCSKLTGSALSPNAEAALPASEALELTTSPACLPALKRLAVSGYQSRESALDGISRIGGSAALNAMLDLVPRASAELLPKLASRLRRFCGESQDAEISRALAKLGLPGCP